MYTLVKIRTLYLKRHKIKFCINYLFLPLILFLITFSSEPTKYKSIILELNIDPDSEYFKFKEIKEIQTYKKNIVRILTNNRNLSEKFVNTSKKYSINPLNFEIYEDYSLLSKQNIYSNDSMIEIKEEKNNVIIFRIKDDSLNLRDLEEINSQFDFNRSRKLYGKTITAGEVGCTLSHRKIYKQIVDDNIPYALLLEDDMAIQRDLNLIDLDAVDKLLKSSKP